MSTRHAFTLIELMIVIAIIAIIAAIAIPNLLESRVTSQEAAAATALRTGLLPAQVQFQAGDYCDLDTNGVGTYAVDGVQGFIGTTQGLINPYNAMCGGNSTTVGTSISLTLLAPSYTTAGTYALGDGTISTSASMGGAGVWPEVSGFCFKTPMTVTAPSGASDNTGERVWAALVFPMSDTQGRKFFGISTAGNIYMSKPSATAFDSSTVGVGGLVTTPLSMFGATLAAAPSSASFLPYHR